MLSIRLVAEKIRRFTSIETNNYIHLPYPGDMFFDLKVSPEGVFKYFTSATLKI
jgi:hypothetical protein